MDLAGFFIVALGAGLIGLCWRTIWNRREEAARQRDVDERAGSGPYFGTETAPEVFRREGPKDAPAASAAAKNEV